MSSITQTKTAEQILEERRERDRTYMRKYRKEHPEYAKRNQINSARLLLERNGWTVIPPDGSTGGVSA